MVAEYEIIEVFEITNRGVVAVIAETTERSVGETHKVEVVAPNREVVKTEAFKQFMHRRQPTPVEQEVYLLNGLHKPEVPVGSRLRFLD